MITPLKTHLLCNVDMTLVPFLKAGLVSSSVPPVSVTTLLNLFEFTEHTMTHDKMQTVTKISFGYCRTLGALAEKCHAFAKALHYKEYVYNSSLAMPIDP